MTGARGTGKFQFTPLREGRRAWMGEEALEDLISIHAPPRGATNQLMEAEQAYNISIHAPPRGATGGSVGIFRLRSISIHAPPRGATRFIGI